MKKQQIEDDRLELLFRHAGLSEKQATLYRLLLTDGETRPSTLSKKSGIKRGNVYALLKYLSFRGLVSEFEKEKVTYFRPEPPEKIASLIEAREKDVNIAKSLAADLLPRLTSQWKTSINRPIVQIYEGKDGMEKVLEDIYGPKRGDNIVWGAVDIERMHLEFPEKLEKKLIPFAKTPVDCQIHIHRQSAAKRLKSAIARNSVNPTSSTGKRIHSLRK